MCNFSCSRYIYKCIETHTHTPRHLHCHCVYRYKAYLHACAPLCPGKIKEICSFFVFSFFFQIYFTDSSQLRYTAAATAARYHRASQTMEALLSILMRWGAYIARLFLFLTFLPCCSLLGFFSFFIAAV